MIRFISKRKGLESSVSNSINCSNMFDEQQMYQEEEKLLLSVLSTHNKSTVEQGDSLEKLIKFLFERIKLINSIEVTNRDIAIGQIDLQFNTVDEQAYNILG